MKHFFLFFTIFFLKFATTEVVAQVINGKNLDVSYQEQVDTNINLIETIKILKIDSNNITKQLIKNKDKIKELNDSIEIIKKATSNILQKLDSTNKILDISRPLSLKNDSVLKILKSDSTNYLKNLAIQKDKLQRSNSETIDYIKNAEDKKSVNSFDKELQPYKDNNNKINNYMLLHSKNTLNSLRSLITNDTLLVNDNLLNVHIANIKCNGNIFSTLNDSIQKYREAINFINEVKKFLEAEYNPSSYLKIRGLFPNMSNSTTLFSEKQTDQLQVYFEKYKYYCVIYDEFSKSVNDSLALLSKKLSEKWKLIDSLKKSDEFNFSPQFTFLNSKKKEIISKLEGINLNEAELNGLNMNTINECPR
jgi:hypothetical protein